MPARVVYELGRRWYQERLSMDWRRPDSSEVEEIFAGFGLTGPFWSIS